MSQTIRKSDIGVIYAYWILYSEFYFIFRFEASNMLLNAGITRCRRMVVNRADQMNAFHGITLSQVQRSVLGVE